MLSRRTVLVSALAAGRSAMAVAQSIQSAIPVTVLNLERRTIEVNGKSASVFGIRQPNGTYGLTTEVGEPFRVRLENHIDQPSLIHWHGLPRLGSKMASPVYPGRRSRQAPAPITSFRCATAAPFTCTPIKDCRSSH